MRNPFYRYVLAISILLLSGCASSVGNRASFEDAKFIIGSTQKQEVAEKLGFPAQVSRSNDLLLWGYPASPRLTGLIIAAPTGTNAVSTYSIDIDSRGKIFTQAAMIYGFDEQGVLRQVIDQR